MKRISIWWYAFGYFACYVPYSATTKALTSSRVELPAMFGEGTVDTVAGFRLLPLSVGASLIGMFTFITIMGWWKHAPRRGPMNLPSPGLWTFLSGLCTATIIGTTTLAYTFEGVSIVFMMLLMRGGVLIIAPIVDKLTGRKTHWYSFAGMALSLGALVVAFAEKGGFDLKLVAAIDITFYLLAYFIRFQFMSRLAKSDDPNQTLSYFVQEQMTATPVLFLGLVVAALIGGPAGSIPAEIRQGFVGVPGTSALPWVLAIGIMSQGTGIFGSLIFLDRRENTFCVPVNRSSSIMAGVIASYALWALFDQPLPSAYKLGGAAMIIVAILFLTIPPAMEKRRKKAAEAAAAAAA